MDASLTDRGVRASDGERARAVASLRRHYAMGRLETHELEERIAAAYRARWRGELRALFRDMPFEPLRIDRARVALAVNRGQRALLHAHVITWAIVNVVVLGVWAWEGKYAAWAGVVFVLTTALLLCHTWGSRALSRRLAASEAGHRRLRPPGEPV